MKKIVRKRQSALHYWGRIGVLRLHSFSVVSLFLLGFSCPLAWAQQLAISAATLHTVSSSGTIQDSVVLIENGKITQIGSAADITVPDGYTRLTSDTVTPGFIDAHSVVGLAGWYNVLADQDQDETTAPNQAELRAIDGFNPSEPLLAYLLQHGVTVIQAGPGRSNPIGGQAGIFKTHGSTMEAMTLRFPSAMIFTLGEVPKKTYGERKQAPMTRMGTAALIRQALLGAQSYAKQWQDYASSADEASADEVSGDEASEHQASVDEVSADEVSADEVSENKDHKAPDRDLKKEALAAVVQGELPALFTVHREDDILTALRIAKEFNLTLVLDAATEGYLVAPEIQQAGVPVIVHPSMQRISSLETSNTSLENAAILADAGIRIALQSGFESYVPKTRIILFEAAIAMVNGLGFERALRAITLDAAQILGIDARVGSLEAEKDADLVLFDGDPFEYTSHIQMVILNGQVVYQQPPVSP